MPSTGDRKNIGEIQHNEEFRVTPEGETPTDVLPPEDWPLLLKNYTSLNVRSNHFTALEAGWSPLRRPFKEHIKYGMINLDKPSNPSSHEVASWIKRILKCVKTGRAGTLDPKVTGTLIICIDRATRLVKSQQNAGKTYMGVLRLHDTVGENKVLAALERLTGPCFQRPPLFAAGSKQLHVYSNSLIEYDERGHLAVFETRCDGGIRIRSAVCVHLGLLLSVGASMEEMRCISSGVITEGEHSLHTIHDVLDAMWLYEIRKDQAYLRRIVLPCEYLLTGYKRIMVKDSAINAVCYGAKLMIPGLARFDDGIGRDDLVIIISTKGEAVSLAYAEMTTSQMGSFDHGIVARSKRVIMDRDTYPAVPLKRDLLVEGGKTTPSDDWYYCTTSATAA